MPHVDDGTLHALLDGALRAEDPARADVVEAHLQSCPDCRALRPDFQEVLVRAGGTLRQEGADDRTSRLRRHARTTRAAAWAATVVLALGTGYLIRDRLVTDTPPAATTTARTTTAEARRTPMGDAAAGAGARPTPAAPDRTDSEPAAPERAAPEPTAGAPARAAAREPAPPRVAGARTDDAASRRGDRR
jgi:hypothetical protein